MYNIRLDNAVEAAIKNAGGKTSKAVKAMLDMSGISLNEKGELVGAKEQLAALKENSETGYLFGDDAHGFKGVQIGRGNSEEKDTKDMSYDELCAYLDKDN